MKIFRKNPWKLLLNNGEFSKADSGDMEDLSENRWFLKEYSGKEVPWRFFRIIHARLFLGIGEILEDSVKHLPKKKQVEELLKDTLEDFLKESFEQFVGEISKKILNIYEQIFEKFWTSWRIF